MCDFLDEIQPLLLLMVRSLISTPDIATVQIIRFVSPITIEVRVAPDDMGMVIGKEGRTARAIRIIAGAAAKKF